MADVVNLRRDRKDLARRTKEADAEAARAKHGVPKAARLLADARRESDARRLDGHRRDPVTPANDS